MHLSMFVNQTRISNRGRQPRILPKKFPEKEHENEKNWSVGVYLDSSEHRQKMEVI